MLTVWLVSNDSEERAAWAREFEEAPYDVRVVTPADLPPTPTDDDLLFGAILEAQPGDTIPPTPRIRAHVDRRVIDRQRECLQAAEHRMDLLVENQRLRREFLRTIAHDLATPMTPLVGYLELMVSGELGPLTDLQMQSLRSLKGSSERLRSLVDSLLDMSRLERGQLRIHRRPIDVRLVCAEAIEQTQAKFTSGDVELRYELGGDALPANGDPDQLRRVLAHVFDGALQVSPRETTVVIELGPCPAKSNCTYLVTVGNTLDTTLGEALPKLFDLEYTEVGSGSRTHGGVGLGLAFAARVVRLMGGDLVVVDGVEQLAGVAIVGRAVQIKIAVDPPISQEFTF